MPNSLVTLAMVGLLAGPSLGVVNTKLMADETLLTYAGQTTRVHILAKGTVFGLACLGGDIAAQAVVTTGGPVCLSADVGSFAWVPLFTSGASVPCRLGAPGAQGGWNDIGSQQTDYMMLNPDYGKAEYVEVASYTVTAVSNGRVTLSFVGGNRGGFLPRDTDKSKTIGTATPVQILVAITPEPATIALLALGGLTIRRRGSR